MTTTAPPETVEDKIGRLRLIQTKITEANAEMNRMAVERSALMMDLHEAGLSNVQIAEITGLTRQRVSTLMAPAIRQRVLGRGKS